MKYRFLTSAVLYLAIFSFVGCGHKQIEIVGTWVGNSSNDCGQSMFSGGMKSAKYDFQKDGICKITFEGSNNVDDNIMYMPDSKYKLVGDSLVLSYPDSAYPQQQSFNIKVQNDNNIILELKYKDPNNPKRECVTLTELTRKAD